MEYKYKVQSLGIMVRDEEMLEHRYESKLFLTAARPNSHLTWQLRPSVPKVKAGEDYESAIQ